MMQPVSTPHPFSLVPGSNSPTPVLTAEMAVGALACGRQYTGVALAFSFAPLSQSLRHGIVLHPLSESAGAAGRSAGAGHRAGRAGAPPGRGSEHLRFPGRLRRAPHPAVGQCAGHASGAGHSCGEAGRREPVAGLSRPAPRARTEPGFAEDHRPAAAGAGRAAGRRPPGPAPAGPGRLPAEVHLQDGGRAGHRHQRQRSVAGLLSGQGLAPTVWIATWR